MIHTAWADLPCRKAAITRAMYVWKAILHYGDTQLQENISDCNTEHDADGGALLTDYAKEQVLLYTRRMFNWCCRCFNCARSSDTAGLRLSGSFIATTRRGTLLTLDECSAATVGSVSMWNTKTYKNKWSPPHNVNAPRKAYVSHGYDVQRMNYWYWLERYVELSALHRAQMTPQEADHLLIGTRVCGKRLTKRKT